MFVRTADDGSFTFKDIPKGPLVLRSSYVVGYQDAIYDPENEQSPFSPFLLKDGEHRSGIVLKAKEARRIAGKIVDEKGHVPHNIKGLSVLACLLHDDDQGYDIRTGTIDRDDGSYWIDGLSGKPVYVVAMDWHAAKEGNALPPVYYPGTIFHDHAKLVTFANTRSVENVDITLRKEGRLVLEGTVRDEAGKPVPEAFVVVDHRDRLWPDFVTGYTDQQGHYRIQGLGDRACLVHIDAVHRGLARTCTPIDLAKAKKTTHRDFILTRGVLISGKLVDEKGHEWQIAESHGNATVADAEPKKGDRTPRYGMGVENKYRSAGVRRDFACSFTTLRKDNLYEAGEMLFPTKSTFAIQGMTPGHTKVTFAPRKKGKRS